MYPNFYIRTHNSDKNEFMYLFIALGPLFRGFDLYRPVVIVDGAYLDGSYIGTFVFESTLDGVCMISVLEL